MKKIISLILAVVLTLSMSVTAFAESSLPFDGATGQSTVTYTVDSSFCVIIPETLDGFNGFSLTADYMKISDSLQLNVYVNGDDPIEMTNECGDTMTVRFNTSANNGSAIASFVKGQTQSDIFVTVQPTDDQIPEAGYYTGTVEFVVRLETKPQQ